MCNINKDKLDEALFDALQMPGDTEYQRFQRTVRVANLKHAYGNIGVFWPPLDAEQRKIFDMCTVESKQMGIFPL